MLAAGLYLGLLKRKDEVSDFIKSLRGFGHIRYREIGTPYFVGTGNNVEVYTIGVAKESSLIERAVNELINVIDVDDKEKKVINVSSALSPWTKAGILLRRLHMMAAANWFIQVGARAEVDKVAKLLKRHGMENEILE